MSLLTLVQNVCIETGWSASPTSVMNNSDKKIQQLKLMGEKAGREIRRRYWLSLLNREHTFDLVANQAAYALPGDYDFEFYSTHYNRSATDFIYGPYTPQIWQYYKSYSATSIDQAYRIKGAGDNRFFIDPTPSASGDTCVFEYQSKNWLRPRTWANAAVYAAGSYTWHDGTIYSTASGGTTSGTSPEDDVGVSDWAIYTGVYDTFTADTDESLLEQDVIERGVKALFKQEYRFDGWVEDKANWVEECEMLAGRTNAAGTIRTDRRQGRWPNIPRTGINNYSGGT